MTTINIYKNYGVLGKEKEYVYTYGAEHYSALCSDVITVTLPDGWTLYHNYLNQEMLESPWGFTYEINEVLAGNKFPQFRAKDKDGKLRYFVLNVN